MAILLPYILLHIRRCYEQVVSRLSHVAGVETEGIQLRGLYRLCIACWIVIGLAWMSGVISVYQVVSHIHTLFSYLQYPPDLENSSRMYI